VGILADQSRLHKRPLIHSDSRGADSLSSARGRALVRRFVGLQAKNFRLFPNRDQAAQILGRQAAVKVGEARTARGASCRVRIFRNGRISDFADPVETRRPLREGNLQMNYFSRLTDIVTCNLGEMLARESDPSAALRKIIAEMEEGLAGARRSVGTATANEERLGREIDELGGQSDQLTEEAREALRNHDESAARVALIRKQEVVDVVGGLEQQHKAACATRDHLNTTLRALEARL
jgi:phage shock protein A